MAAGATARVIRRRSILSLALTTPAAALSSSAWCDAYSWPGDFWVKAPAENFAGLTRTVQYEWFQFYIADTGNGVKLHVDIAGMVAAMTESEPGVQS